jgi:maltose-binding protein MalE
MLFIILGLSIVLLSQCTKSVKEPQKAATGTVVTGKGTGKDPASISESKSLKVTVSMQPAEYNVLLKKTEEYMLNHEDTHVELSNAVDGYADLKKANELGNGPDLMLLDNLWVNEFASLGFLRPMDEFFTGEQQSHGITTLMNQVKWNGYLWAIPKDVDPYILVWNKKIAADNKWNHAPETVEEWLAWNKALMYPELGKYGIYFDTFDPYALLSLLSTLLDNAKNTSLFAGINEDPTLVKKIESFFVPQEELYNSMYLKQNYPSRDSIRDPWLMLKQGDIAAMVTTVSEYKQHTSSSNELAALKLIENDTFETINYGLLKGRSYALSSQSKNEILAIDWIKEMTSSETDLIAWDEAKLLQSLPTAYLTTPISNDSNSNSYKWLIDYGRVLPAEPQINNKITSFKNDWYQVWEGKMSMKAFLEKSVKLWKVTKSDF